jgi:N-acetylmuramoyl-L-alanine amidase
MTTLKRGSRGELVKRVQKALCLIPDGIFGPITEEAVIAFQREHGLKADGIVGLATMARLLKLRKSRRTITEIIVHCTATPEGKDFTVDDIRRWHTTPVSKGGRGWSDIGYHYVIYRDGSLHEGRSIDLVGAHCLGHNAHSIGIVYVGGVATDGKTAKDTRTDEQKAALAGLLIDLRKLYPKASIHGHRDFAPKACPSFDATYEFRHI